MAKKTSLTEKNVAELTDLLSKQRAELRTHRFATAGSRPKDTSAHKNSRREVARILTEMHARTLAADEAAFNEAVAAATSTTV